MRYKDMLDYVEAKLIEGNGIRSTRPYQTFRNRFEHTKRVLGWAKRIADDLPNVDEEVLLTSAIFHDVGYASGKEDHAINSANIFLEYAKINGFTQEFIDAFNVADMTYLTEIDCNREKQEDYPGVTSHIIIDKLNNGDIISDETISKLSNEKDSVVCFMGCAYVDSLIDGFKELMK